MFEAATMILGSVTLLFVFFLFLWHLDWHIEPLCFKSFFVKLQQSKEEQELLKHTVI